MMNSQILLGLYCIISVYYPEPISADLIHGPPSPVTDHSKVPGHKPVNQHIITSTGRRGKIVNYGQLDQVPTETTTETGKTAIETAQNNARASLINSILPEVPISVRNIIKRSAQDSSFPDEFPNVINNGNKKDVTKSVHDCDNDTSFCKKQVFNKEGLQQMTDFKLHNKMPWNRDYSNYYYSDEGSYVPGLHYRNLRLPYFQRIQGSSTNKYYALPSQENMNEIADAYTQTHHSVPNQFSSQFPKVILLSPQEPTTTDLRGQSLAVNSNTQQDSLPIPEHNAGDELEPIQEEKKNIFTSRGWGAGGMPFNILYMHQQQHMKPASRSEVAGAQQLVAPLHGFPTTSQQYRQVAVRNALSSAGGPGAPTPTRRQYSTIPQLYISYGWGPQGK
jgi:hypothetical protein